MKRDPKPREIGKRTQEDLRRVLGKIYPEEMVDELMRNLGKTGDSEEYDESCDEPVPPDATAARVVRHSTWPPSAKALKRPRPWRP